MKVVQNAHVVGDWKYLGRQLGLSENDLHTLEDQYTGMRDRCLHSLVRWREVSGQEANVELLAKHLRKCRYHHVAGKLNTLQQCGTEK